MGEILHSEWVKDKRHSWVPSSIPGEEHCKWCFLLRSQNYEDYICTDCPDLILHLRIDKPVEQITVAAEILCPNCKRHLHGYTGPLCRYCVGAAE